MGRDGVCRQVSDDCKTYNNNTGLCVTCYPSFELLDGVCRGSNKTSDPNLSLIHI